MSFREKKFFSCVESVKLDLCVYATSTNLIFNALFKCLVCFTLLFITQLANPEKLFRSSFQSYEDDLHKKTTRRLLKKDYVPDEFKMPSDSTIGALTEEIRAAYEYSANVLDCPFSTKSCGNSDPSSSYPSGSLGQCALVASGQSILKYKYGNEIDAYDTVFRIGISPMKRKFEASVGSKTDVLFVRTQRPSLHDVTNSIKRDYTGIQFKVREHLPEKFFLTLPSSCQKSKFHGKSILKLKLLSHKECNNFHGCVDVREEVRFQNWYEGFASDAEFANVTESFLRHLRKFRKRGVHDSKLGSKIVFTHGFELILAMLRSNLCTSVRTYGFSKFPTYHYFDRPLNNVGRRVRPGHVMGMEYYILQQLERSGVPISCRASF